MNSRSLSALSIGILAGGKSRRMGQNKALMKIENERMIERTTKELGGFSELLISAAVPGEYEYLGFPVVCDENRNIGPIEGIRRILYCAQSDYVFICAADMPFLQKELVNYLAQFICSDYDCYVITDEEHMQPLCAIYSRAVLPVIEKLIAQGRYRLREILAAVRTKYVPLQYTCFDKRVVRNINTRADYEQAVRPTVFCVSGCSNSGKTWLIMRLINEFIHADYRVAVLKHDGHDTYRDVPGSDTENFWRCGAQSVGIFADTQFALHCRQQVSPEAYIAALRRQAQPPDVLIIEGLKHCAYPKIAVLGEGDSCKMQNLICAVTDWKSPEHLNCPVYRRDQIREIFLCIQAYFSFDWSNTDEAGQHTGRSGTGAVS